MLKKLLLIIAVLLVSAAPLSAQSPDTILVAGFQNYGSPADDNLNIVLTKSLISLLSCFSDVRVVSYESVEQIVSENGFWKTNTVNMDTIDSMGLRLAVQKIVFGNYRVDTEKTR